MVKLGSCQQKGKHSNLGQRAFHFLLLNISFHQSCCWRRGSDWQTQTWPGVVNWKSFYWRWKQNLVDWHLSKSLSENLNQSRKTGNKVELHSCSFGFLPRLYCPPRSSAKTKLNLVSQNRLQYTAMTLKANRPMSQTRVIDKLFILSSYLFENNNPYFPTSTVISC